MLVQFPRRDCFRSGWLVCGLAAALAVTGCSKKEADQGGVAGQVIAHVGSDDVTAQELENEFRLANVPPDKRSEAVTKHFLEEIVVRKYLVQQAIAAKLDREPTVHLDIMRSREQVLASAIVQRDLSGKASSIGKSEVDQFIAAHPSQFAKRMVLNIDEIGMPIGPQTQAAVDATKSFKTLEQVDQKLKEMNIAHTRSTGVLDSGDISDQFLAALQAKKDDDIFFVRQGTNGTFFKVTSEEPRPLSGDEADNRARQMMRMEILKAAGEETKKAAENTTKYEGEYVKIMQTDASASPNAAEQTPTDGSTASPPK